MANGTLYFQPKTKLSYAITKFDYPLSLIPGYDDLIDIIEGIEAGATVKTDGETITGDGSAEDPVALLRVISDNTLSGAGTLANPLSVVPPTVAWEVDVLPVLSDGQTAFELSKTPSDPDGVFIVVNSVTQLIGIDYTISGKDVTWLDTNYILETTDCLWVRYTT